MRYSIRFPALLRCCDGLEKTARQHIRELEELRQTRQSLSRLSGMEAVLAGIDRELTEMEDQKRVLLVMAQAARRAHQIYRDTENTVIDKADCPSPPLTELKLTGEGGRPGSGPVWQVTVSAAGGTSTAVKIEKLDVRGYTALLTDMNVTLKAAR